MTVRVTEAGVDEATDGRRIIIVRSVRLSDDAAEPTIESVYQVKHAEGFTTNPQVVFLHLLSCTRQDAHESVVLDEDEQELVEGAARDTAAADDPTW